jgi:hypothetical protein
MQLVSKERIGKHIPAAKNTHATIDEAVFSVGTALRLHNEELKQLEVDLRESPELAVGRIIE